MNAKNDLWFSLRIGFGLFLKSVCSLQFEPSKNENERNPWRENMTASTNLSKSQASISKYDYVQSAR